MTNTLVILRGLLLLLLLVVVVLMLVVLVVKMEVGRVGSDRIVDDALDLCRA